MKEILIKTNDEAIITDAEMLKIKAGFYAFGFKTFPNDVIIERCPYKDDIKKASDWMKQAQSVWIGRNRNKSIINAFSNALEDLRHE